MEYNIGDRVRIVSGSASGRHVHEAMIASSMTLLLYDWLLILPQEVNYIWRASWNWSKVLYLLTRYTPFATLALVFQNHLSLNPTPESCKRTIRAISGLSFVSLDLVEIVLAVRTYAVWKRDKRVGIGLALLFILCQIPRVVIMEKFISTINYIQNPYPGLYIGCVFNKATNLVFVNWVVFSIAEGVDLVLMIISALKTCQHLLDVPSLWIKGRTDHKYTSNLMTVVYRDGIRFYLYVFCATLVSVLITILLPIYFVGIGSDIEIVLHSILTCRLMIGIREASQSFGHKSETFELSDVPCHSTLEFAPKSPGESV